MSPQFYTEDQCVEQPAIDEFARDRLAKRMSFSSLLLPLNKLEGHGIGGDRLRQTEHNSVMESNRAADTDDSDRPSHFEREWFQIESCSRND
jgi:hypothetical protein